MKYHRPIGMLNRIKRNNQLDLLQRIGIISIPIITSGILAYVAIDELKGYKFPQKESESVSNLTNWQQQQDNKWEEFYEEESQRQKEYELQNKGPIR